MRKTNSTLISPEQMRILIDTALGKIEADLTIVNSNLVNGYTGGIVTRLFSS